MQYQFNIFASWRMNLVGMSLRSKDELVWDCGASKEKEKKKNESED